MDEKFDMDIMDGQHNATMPVVHDVNEIKSPGVYLLKDDKENIVGYAFSTVCFNEYDVSTLYIINPAALNKAYLMREGVWVLQYEEYVTPDGMVRGAVISPDGTRTDSWHPFCGFDVRKAARFKDLAKKAEITEHQLIAILSAVKELI